MTASVPNKNSGNLPQKVPPVVSLNVAVREVFEALKPAVRHSRRAPGRRYRWVLYSSKGKYRRAVEFRKGGSLSSVAVDASLRAAILRQSGVGSFEGTRVVKVEVTSSDLRQKICSGKAVLALVVVVDNSFSLYAERVIEIAKGLIHHFLLEAGRHRDKVGLVAFTRDRFSRAAVVLPLTSSAELALRRLRELPLSHRTPLAAGLAKARWLLRQENFKNKNCVPAVIVVTDGLPNVPLKPGGDAHTDALDMATLLEREGIALVVICTDTRQEQESFCSLLAAVGKGCCFLASRLIIPPVWLQKEGG